MGLQAGELEVATVTSVAFGVLPVAFERWHERYPGTTITLREYTHRRALDDAVRGGVGDIAVGPQPTDWPGLVVELGREEFVAILPASDPLASRKRPLALDELAERDWVLFGPEHGLSELILEACAHSGFAPRRTGETCQVAAATHLAAAGLGVTIVPRNVVQDGLHAAVLSLKPLLMCQLVAFTRQDWSPLAAAFLEVLQTQTGESRPGSAITAG
jgi:DNA-binding transcriptional LysR family regulator